MRKLLLLTLIANAALADVRLPLFKRQVLDNGVVIYAMPRTDVPLVVIRALVRGGAESDPAEMPGLAAVTAEMLRRGTATRTAAKFANELDSLGATLEIDIDNQSTVLTLECLAKDFKAGLALLNDAIRNPSFDPAELKKLIAQRIDEVKAAKDDPRSAGGQYWRAFFYGPGHPYGRVPSEESLAKIDRKNVAEYHARMYRGANFVIAAVGAVDTDPAAAGLQSSFGSIAKGQQYAWKSADPPKLDRSRAALIDKPDATQTAFYIGQPGIPRNHPDRVPLWLVNTLFGGRFTSLLNDELRVNSGLTYGIRSSVDLNHLTGRISIGASTSTENTVKAVDMSLEIMKRLAEKGISEEQLQSTKAYVKGIYPSERLETPDQLAQILTELELYDLNRGEIDDLFARIDAVTVEQASAIARKYFTGAPLTFLFLGQAAKIRDGVKKYAPQLVEAPISRAGFHVP